MTKLIKFISISLLFLLGIICVFADMPDYENVEINLVAFTIVKVAGFGLLYLFYQLAYVRKWARR